MRTKPALLGGLLAALALTPGVSFAQPDPLNTVILQSGTINGQTINRSSATVRVFTGDPLLGSFTGQVHNGMDPRTLAPVAATLTWGEPSTVWWPIADVKGMVDTVQTVYLPSGLKAPTTEGTYYLAVAMAGYCSADELLSLAQPCHGSDWGDPDLATLPAEIFETAASQGWAATPATPPEIGMASIKIVVGRPVLEPPQASGGQITIKWDRAGTLQWGPTPNGPWTDLSGRESISVLIDLKVNRFFRVIRR